MLPGLRTWQLGVKSLALHPMRSLLTVLGIFIGVASVIWLLAIGEGISLKAQEQIEALGADNIIVRSIKPPESASSTSVRTIELYGVTRADHLRLKETIPTVRRTLPIRELRRRFRSEHHNVDGRLVGCTVEYADVMRLELQRGHFITDAESRNKDNHCVLSAEVAERLFPLEDSIGQAIHIDKDYYVVVGVTKSRAPSAGIGGSLAAQDFSNDVYVPIETVRQRIGDLIFTSRSGSFEGEKLELSQVTLRIDRVENVMETAKIVEDLLDRYHDQKDYGVTVPLELLEQARTTRLMFMAFMGLIAAVSLVVGGIGIMNIMLATVTERTREIGIRRALGAKRSDITQQFLVETIVLSVVGGVTGIAGGYLCSPTIVFSQRKFAEWFPSAVENLPEVVRSIRPEVVPWSIPLAFGISVAVGVIFGIYPAMRAAEMDPIEALRHE